MKQFRTRDSATAFLRKNGVAKEHYNHFITSDVVGGKPVFIVDTDDMETYLSCKDTDKKMGTNLVDGNFGKENSDGSITKGSYYNEDGTVKSEPEPEQVEENAKKAKTKSQKKIKPLAGSALDERARERLDKKQPKTAGGKSVGRNPNGKPLNNKGQPGLERLIMPKPTKGILKDYPDAPTNSIRAFIMYLILEKLDDDLIYAAMREVFGDEKCEGKRRYPRIYRKQMSKAGQLDDKGRPKKH